ncbi:N-6 DNA methylase [Algoriphagus ratkowskyi]|uniref:site-specific DNA-methyltransferase (adenine-specific) n=1 Tax=Algoriphagus ratkowskyi TaxID=57028 RepID=A0A2W7QW91_9BACT|nr:N-6 DNA methylase [Algoriphagus ratkowskyi]PZX52798.1 N-6 DNA methylase [Algoriphagus ratkowskyi]TXD76260.1 SAM-dependent DNA methyltransferase [Algoriphagus ratkowskyi]
MPLFQSSVLKKYSSAQDQSLITTAYDAYKTYFYNPLIQENIRNSKEEQFQEGFLREMFVNILGYTINPNPEYNLTTELKNIKDAKKTDGAILKDGKALAVIELKGTDTKDLDKIRDQAFNYKNNQPECVFVITSNFEKLRFYIHNAVDHEEFHLFTLSRERFELLWLLLEKENLLNRIPEKIKTESLLVEEQVTKKLYSDYSSFKQDLWQDMVIKNPEVDELLLYKKSQKLLDRFLFIFFAEDKGLLPPNSISEIAKQWEKLAELDEYRPLYDRFKKYFGYMNSGRAIPGKAEIHAYNGGLFAPDPLLDGLLIDDQLLKKHTIKLSEYDFDTEVDTNILGHIFEHSLNDIENVRAHLAGEQVDKSKTKRKKDGVFYTPKYITKYIVDNTVGKLCAEKKAEVKLVDEEFGEGKKSKKKRADLKDKLDSYRNWLLEITICDPACGSGAFLNQALEFLMAEHRYLDELESLLFGTPMVLPNVENHILERNIFGVDINEESVEIARLSLWLRTAKKGRKLSSLSSNIKVGNSLIDDPEVAGDLAFHWEAEFPQVFTKGGFDAVIGNPPYVNINTLPDIHDYLKIKYSEIHTGYNDLMYYFIYKGIDIINDSGTYGVITSNYFLGNDYADKLRLFLNKHLEIIVNFEKELVFEDANVHTTLVFAKKITKTEFMQFYTYNDNESLKLVDLVNGYTFCELERVNQSNKWVIANSVNQIIINKIHIDSKFLGDICEIEKGSTSGKNSVFTIDYEYAEMAHFENELLRKNVKNGDINRYSFVERGNYLIYTDNNTELENFPNINFYLNQFKDELSSRNEAAKGIYSWFRLERPRDKALFDSHEKLIVPYRAVNNRFAYDNQQFFNDGGDIRILVLKANVEFSMKYLLALLNSKLLDWFYGFIGKSKGASREYFNKPLSEIPIKIVSANQQGNIIELVDSIMDVIDQKQKGESSFINLIQSKFSIEKPSTKLQHWPDLDFKGFLGELKKAKVKLSLGEEAEWMAYFTEQKQKALALQSEINRIDAEIDQLVYELYGLTEEEIRIVEGGEG